LEGPFLMPAVGDHQVIDIVVPKRKPKPKPKRKVPVLDTSVAGQKVDLSHPDKWVAVAVDAAERLVEIAKVGCKNAGAQVSAFTGMMSALPDDAKAMPKIRKIFEDFAPEIPRTLGVLAGRRIGKLVVTAAQIRACQAIQGILAKRFASGAETQEATAAAAFVDLFDDMQDEDE